MTCLIPWLFAPGLSFPYPSRRLMTPHTARPAPRATTSVCKIVIADVKNAIFPLFLPPCGLINWWFPFSHKMNRPDFSLSCPYSGQKNSSHSLTAAKKPLIICGCFHAAKFTVYRIQFLFLHCAPIRRTCQINYIPYRLTSPFCSYSSVCSPLASTSISSNSSSARSLSLCSRYPSTSKVFFLS